MREYLMFETKVKKYKYSVYNLPNELSDIIIKSIKSSNYDVLTNYGISKTNFYLLSDLEDITENDCEFIEYKIIQDKKKYRCYCPYISKNPRSSLPKTPVFEYYFGEATSSIKSFMTENTLSGKILVLKNIV